MKSFLIKMLLILAVSTMLGFVNNSFNPNKVQIGLQRPQTKAVADSLLLHNSDGQPVYVNKYQVKQLVLQGAKILDVRLPEEYQTGHVENAVNIPFELLGDYVEQIDQFSHKEWLITYCDGPPCEKSVLMADELVAMGFARVAIYYDGLADWTSDEGTHE